MVQLHQSTQLSIDTSTSLGENNFIHMNVHRLLELVSENMETDRYAFAKIIEQEERLFLATKATEL
jgi:hypothetical protein